MEFKAAATVVFLLLSLALMALMISKAAKQREKNLRDIVNSAKEGEEDSLYFTPPEQFDLCEYVNGGPGCGALDVGVEGGCVLEKDTEYFVRAYPLGDRICLNVTVTGFG